MGVNELSVQLAREDWRNGERIVERILADPGARSDRGERHARAGP